MIVDLYIGSSRLSLFKDETIELTSSVQSINDISKITTDFIKNFTVPADDNNNTIFKHYYNYSISDGYDARTTTDGRIDIDGILFREGKWKLESVEVIKGVAKSYAITFRGNLINLKDLFKDDELSALDLSAFNHDYTSANVKAGLEGGLFGGAVIYNLFAKKQYYYKSDSGDNTQTATLTNIAWGGGSNTGVKWNDLKPSIKLLPIIEAIETKYSITFSRHFFNRAEFTKLFTWCNNDSVLEGMKTIDKINFTTQQSGSFSYGFDLTSDTWNIATGNNNYNYKLNFNFGGFNNKGVVSIIVKNGDEEVFRKNINTTGLVGASTPYVFLEKNKTYALTFHIEASEAFYYETFLEINNKTVVGQSVFKTAVVNNFYTNVFINKTLPKIKVFDFVKGLFNMFKLVAIPTSSTSFYVNTLVDYYYNGKVIDLTRYIDSSTMTVSRGQIYNTLKFNFEEPSTILAKQFKINTGKAYGDEEAYIKDDLGNLLDGDTFELKVPFEQIVYEKLNDLDGNLQTNIVYAAIVDESISPVNPKMHFFYNLPMDISSTPIGFRNESNVKLQVDSINIPNHILGLIQQQYSTTFSAENTEYTGVISLNNLYTNYYQDYINGIFDIKQRSIAVNSKNIPTHLLKELQLNDVIKIGYDYYRINNFTTNLISREIKFDLYTVILPIKNGLQLSQNFMSYGKDGGDQTIEAYNLNDFDYSTTDLWISARHDGDGVINISIASTTVDRYGTVTIIDLVTSQTQTIEIYQTFDI